MPASAPKGRPNQRGGSSGGRAGAAGTGARTGTTRERLVRAASGILEEGGYAAASVQAVAGRAGVSAGALYRHFPSKAELFVDVYRDAARKDLAAIDEAAAAGSVLERLDAAVSTHARRALRRRRLAWALLYEPVDPLVDAERLVHRRKYCLHMAGLLRQGIAAGEIPEQDVELTAAALVGAIAESLVGPLSPVAGRIVAVDDVAVDDAAVDEVVATLVRFCHRSVGALDAPPPGAPTAGRARRDRSAVASKG